MNPQQDVDLTKHVAGSVKKADEALARADVTELHALFMEARRDEAKALSIFEGVVEHYAGTNKNPRITSENAISAMREVALAAIELAKATLGK